MADGLTEVEKVSLPAQWYTRRGGVIRGPFSVDEITRHFLLGRICLDDELSQDRVAWRSAHSCSDLLPSELQNLSSREDYQQLVIARMQVDERRGERRCQQCSNCSSCHSERRTSRDRRGKDNDRLVSQYLFGQADSSVNRSTEQSNLRPWLLTTLLVTMVFAWLLPIRI
ncbi:MAG: hypothetical protein ABFS24_06300 [Pseudomonadota bacterium]